jgi:ribose 5-phosphate isomerase A
MNLKHQAAARALEFVRDGMYLGLGSGTTATQFINLLGEQIQSGRLRDIRGVPTSSTTEARARALGIPLVSLTECLAWRRPPLLDLDVDGADEVDPHLNLIKGQGMALLREKIIASQARRFVIIADESKLVSCLGRGPLPVEILPFEAAVQVNWLEGLGCRAELWREADGSPVVTDNGNFLVRCWFSDGIPDPAALARRLADQPGIIEHGLFLNMARQVVVASPDGVRVLER